MKARMPALLLGLAVVSAAKPSWRLRIVHVNDIHSHLDPSPVTLALDTPTKIHLGGAVSLAGAFAALRVQEPENLTLHAGDEFSGTSWFSHYQGLADAAVLDRMGFDAFVPGNHEFDKGPAVLGRFLDSLHVPALAANLESSREPTLAGKLRPALTLVRHGVRIGIVGVACPETPGISSPGKNLVFRPAASVRVAVDSLRRRGTEIVILLSHAGFGTDTVLARIPGVDVVVGGHSHTRQGDFRAEGLSGSSPHPYAVHRGAADSVPVVQAWEWGKEIGVLDLEMMGGMIRGWRGGAFLPLSDSVIERNGRHLDAKASKAILLRLGERGMVRTVRPDTGMGALLQQLARPLDSLRTTVIGNLPKPLTRRGELLGACAQALRDAAGEDGAEVGLVNAGGVREDIEAGSVTLEEVKRVQPFGNAVTILTLSGKELLSALRVLRTHHGHRFGLDGARLVRDSAGIDHLIVEGRGELSPSDTVRVATNSYLAGGGDGCRMLRDAVGRRRELPIDDAAALEAWIGRHFPQVKPALQRAE